MHISITTTHELNPFNNNHSLLVLRTQNLLSELSFFFTFVNKINPNPKFCLLKPYLLFLSELLSHSQGRNRGTRRFQWPQFYLTPSNVQHILISIQLSVIRTTKDSFLRMVSCRVVAHTCAHARMHMHDHSCVHTKEGFPRMVLVRVTLVHTRPHAHTCMHMH